MPHLFVIALVLDCWNCDDTVDDDGVVCSGITWFIWLNVELISCGEVEIEEAPSNGAKVNPFEENDDWGFCGIWATGLIDDDDGLNGELFEWKS